MATSRPKSERGRVDLVEIQKLIELIENSPITEFELEEHDLKIRISKNGASHGHVQLVQSPLPHTVAGAMPALPSAPGEVLAAGPRSSSVIEFKSPMVGTYYRAPSPDADPYVRVGDVVEPGRVLCIIEAMKLMNEIECEVRGKIVEILVENAQPVEFGQVIFRIDSSAV
ncbi:acetyl-CoA carboxylase biotin carboxyl carrier protein [candidate division KSB1 bacterium]|nr:acetyl-CoA carboxylase biotin carboxyl carrier protein [candidate division KSB1 bacterium]